MRKKFHGLKRPKIRQSWHKFNLYNLSRQRLPNADVKTFFQQKWNAKALTRAYHGEQIREKQWQRMFRPHMASVVPMSHQYLARFDGSEQAAGRGSGLDKNFSEEERRSPQKTPYMNMVYAPTERRLDTAIFRALFASSTRQARQFVVHGFVKVNGKKMIYPGYLLNPGDMFQVEPERVLFGTGAMKNKEERKETRRLLRNSAKAEDAEEPTASESTEGVEGESKEAAKPSSEAEKPQDPKKTIKSLLESAKNFLADPSETLSAKRKQELRAFQRTLKKTLSRKTTTTSITDDLDAQFLELTSKLKISSPSTSSPPSETATSTEEQKQSPAAQTSEADRESLSPADLSALRAALKEARDNPIDPSKPYATPWRPRPYMSAFAFIPPFLEVNQNICSAVYLRHPVARPGTAEVPTPFHPETSQLAFNWYLRRR
ncbi:MAG: hypothetical protein M1819_004694 [Sarea resinae]|nr:MAG: hypothetical protein M1819_004694 [Sarea resinae]